MSEGQEYYPYKKTGIALHLLLVLLLLGGIGFLLFLVFSRPAGWPLAIYLLVTLLLLALLPLIAYRGYALYRALYVIERDGLRVRWGLRSEDLPLTEVLWVRPASDLITPLTLPKFSMPGAILGNSSHKELGELEFIASKTADLVIVAAVEKTLVLSPQDPEEFSRRFQRVIEMGSLAPIAPHTTIPAAYMQSVFQDQLAKTLLAISILLTLLFLIVTSILIPFRSMVSIGYDFNAVSLPAVPANRLLMLPILALFFMVVNVISGFFFYRRKETRTITYFVWAAGILTPLLLFVSVLLIFLNPV